MMSQLIKNLTPAVNTWKMLELAEGDSPESVTLPDGDVIVPFAVWQARKSEIISCHKRIGLLIQPDDPLEALVADLDYFIVIAINFPRFVDGRGYSTASLLRQRHAYQGELRAVGDVLHDQLFFLHRVGFDSFVLKDGKNLAYAIEAGFSPFSDTYQTSTNQPQPYFRRRA